MDWDKILQIALKLIADCTAKDGSDTVAKRMASGGALVRFALTHRLREAGLRGTDLRMAVEDVLTSLSQATKVEIAAIIEQSSREHPE